MSFTEEFNAALDSLADQGICTEKTFIYVGATCPGCKTKAKYFRGYGAWVNSAGRGIAVYILCTECVDQQLSGNPSSAITETARKYIAIAMRRAGHVGEDRT